MSNTVNVNIAASDNGSIGKVTNEARKLNKELAAAQKAAASIRPASQTAAVSRSNDIEANRLAKGIGESTGASSRDFAKQAQGLGGLVHVYATFAANLFAVTAAFTALSKAADYSNMVKGLDQLGAASGRNLGSMAKNMVSLTDGALSLRDSMEAVAQSSSAGMNPVQIERMALVAKKASQALGRDMADSMSRLSRGITKMEPELLDELGIFVRVDKASQDYALSIGKTASSLTDFEKRQAFATAALKQAEDKFNNIKLDANPLTKLQASVVNLLYSGGELINKVLGPISKLLSESPMALAGVLAVIASSLLSRAIPAITQWRSELVKTSEEAAKAAKIAADGLQEYNAVRIGERNAQALQGFKDSATSATTALQSSLEKALPATSRLVKRALSEGFVPDDSDVKKYATALTRLNKEVDSTSKVLNSAGIDKDTREAAEKQLATLKERVGFMKLANEQVKISIEEHKKLRVETDKLDNVASKAPWWSMEAARNRIADGAQKKATKSAYLAQFTQQLQTMGMLGALEDMDTRLKDDKSLSTKDKGFLKIKAGAVGAVSSITTMISSLGNLAGYLSVVGVALTAADALFSKNAKEAAAFAGAVSKAEEAVDGYNRTASFYSDKVLFSTDQVQAFANALDSVVLSMDELLNSFKELKKTDNWWSKSKNWLADAFNMDDERQLAYRMASGLEKAMKGPQGDKLTKSLSDQGLIDSSVNSYDKLVKKLDTLANSGDVGAEQLKRINAEAQKFNKESAKYAASTTALKNTIVSAEKAMQQFGISLLPSDAFTKFGIQQMEVAKGLREITDAAMPAENAIASLTELTASSSTAALFGKDIALRFAELAPEIEKVNQNLKSGAAGIEVYSAKIEELKKNDKYYTLDNSIDPASKKSTNLSAEAKAFEAGLKNAKELDATAQKRIESLKKEFGEYSAKVFEDGANKVNSAITAAHREGAISISKALLSNVEGTQGVQIQADLDRAMLDVQRQSIAIQRELTFATKQAAIAYEKASVETKLKDDTLSKSDRENLQRQLSGLKEASTLLTPSGIAGLFDKVKAEQGGTVYKQSAEARNNLGDLYIQNKGYELSEAKIKGQMGVISAKEKIDLISKEYDTQRKEIAGRKEAYSKELELLDLYSSSSTYLDTTVEARRKTLKASIQESDISTKQSAIDELVSKTITNLNGTKDKPTQALIGQDFTKRYGLLTDDLESTKKGQKTDNIKSTLDLENRVTAEKQKQLDTQNKLVDMSTSNLDYLKEANILTKTQYLEEKSRLDISKVQNDYALKADDLERKKSAMSEASYAKEYKSLQDNLTIEQRKIEIEKQYQQALVKTEETLKNIEVYKSNQGDYIGAATQDFNNKITELVNASKSAASVFNENFINAIDSSIDKFYEAMIDGTATMKDVVATLKEGFKSSIKEALSQNVKNLWKTAMHGILGESDQEAAARTAKEQTDNLIDAVKTQFPNLTDALDKLTEALTKAPVDKSGRTTSTSAGKLPTDAKGIVGQLTSGKGILGNILGKGVDWVKGLFSNPSKGVVGQDPNMFGPPEALRAESKDIEGPARDLMKTADIQSGAAEQFASTGSMFQDVVKIFGDKNASFGDKMLSIIQLFGSGITTLISGMGTGLSNILGSFTGGSSGSSGGLLGMLGGLFGGGSSAGAVDAASWGSGLDFGFGSGFGIDSMAGAIWAAKGGVFPGHMGLSAHSNSIVSSPTTFAFARGGVPAHKGLMGESSPEAIIPLKRDAQGNLGIRGGSSGGEVNVVVNNYGKEQATTKETTDSRGNRKIEVTIGDMVAGEMNRTGSSVNNTLKSKYGARETLVRR